METIQLPIQPEVDLKKLDAFIERLEALQEKGYTIPIQFVANMEGLQAQLSKLAETAPKISVATTGIAAPLEEAGVFTNSLIAKLKSVGETGAAEKLQGGFRSVASEVEYLDRLFDEMMAKMRAAARNPQNLISGKMYDWEAIPNLIAQRQSQLAQLPREAMEDPRNKALFDQERSAREKAAKSSGQVVDVERQNRAEAREDEKLRIAAAKARVALAKEERLAREGAGGGGGGRGRGGSGGSGSGAGGGLGGIFGTAASAAKFIGVYRALDLVIRGFEFGADSAVKYERAMATLQIVYRGTRAEASALGLAVLDQASAMGQDGIAALAVATDFARYGLTQAEVLEAVRVATIAANVAQLDLGQSSKFLQAILSGYQLNVGQLSGVLGSLDTVSHRYNVTNLQLLDGLSRVAPLAKQAGISLNELIGFEAVISGRTARPGAEAGTAIKSLISRLTRPTTQTALAEVGVNVFDRSGELKNASQIVNELFVAYANLSRGEQAELLVRVAGTQQAGRLAALFDGYIKSQELAIDASRDLTRAERENVLVRATLQSQLGTLATEWQKFWVSAGGSGAAGGLQSQLTDIVKGLSDMLFLVNAVGQAGSKRAGGGGGEFLNNKYVDAFLQQLPGVGLPAAARQASRQVDYIKKIFGDRFKSDAQVSTEALQNFTKEVDKLQKAGESDAGAVRLFQTISKVISTASPEKLDAMIRAAASVAAPGDLGAQNNIRTQLEALARQGDYISLNARLLELAKTAEADRTKNLLEADKLLDARIGKETTILDRLKKQRDEAAAARKSGTVENLDKQIEQQETQLSNLRRLKAGNLAQAFPEGEDQYASEALNTDKIKTAATSLAKELAQTRANTKREELDREELAARLTLELEQRKIEALVATGRVGRKVADDAIVDLRRERDETIENINFARQYALLIDASARARKEAGLSGKASRSGQNESEDIARERQRLLLSASIREGVTGLPLNIAAARQDISSARSPEARAAAIARLSEFGNRLEEIGFDILSRKLSLEAEITREREKQTREASKNLLMADRETQLRAALAAKLVQQRGGRGFNAQEFGFLDPKDKQAIERGVPSALPKEAQTRLSDLTREYAVARAELRSYSSTIALGRKIQEEATKALTNLLEKIAPSRSGGKSGQADVPGVGDIGKVLDRGTAMFQSTLDNLGAALEARDVAWSNALGALAERVSRTERGTLQSAIGRAQGAASAT